MEQMTKEKIDLSMPIKTIPFATDQRGRIINALRIHGNINSLGELLNLSYKDLRNMRGIGEKTFDTINDWLEENGLHLYNEKKSVTSNKQTHLTTELWEKRFYEVAKDMLIKNLEISNHNDNGKTLNEEIRKSIKVAYKFIDALKKESNDCIEYGMFED